MQWLSDLPWPYLALLSYLVVAFLLYAINERVNRQHRHGGCENWVKSRCFDSFVRVVAFLIYWLLERRQSDF